MVSMGLGDLGGMVLSVVFVVILLAVGSLILDNLGDTMDAGSYAENVTNNGLDLLDTISSSWVEIVVIVGIASIVVYLISRFGGN